MFFNEKGKETKTDRESLVRRILKFFPWVGKWVMNEMAASAGTTAPNSRVTIF